jgi:hypothetical protein
MHRTIAAAAIVFALAAFALQHTTIAGPLEEPLLLLIMGTLFLAVGRLLRSSEHKPGHQLIERRR